MTAPPKVSFRRAVDAKCRECIYDPLARGAWREQVAACESANCALHVVRPVPRQCMVSGRISAQHVAAVRSKLAA